MRIIQTEIRDLWQYLNNQLRNRGNGGGQNWSDHPWEIGVVWPIALPTPSPNQNPHSQQKPALARKSSDATKKTKSWP
jgi:hypothetical protein